MKKLLLLSFFVLTLFFSFSSILKIRYVSAATCTGENGDYCVLAPILDFVPDEVNTKVELTDYLNAMFRLGIALAGALAVIQIIIGGVQYMSTDSISNGKEGKKRITAAVTGLVVALGSYMLLNTLSPSLLNTKLNLDAVNVQALPPLQQTQILYDMAGQKFNPDDFDPVTGQPLPNSTPPQDDPSIPDNRSEDTLRKFFADNGISVNKDACANAHDTNCTRLAGLGEAAVSGLVSLRNQTGADLVITGGTEDGHLTHGIEKPIADVRFDPAIESYVNQNTSSTKGSGYGTVYTLNNGDKYLKEGDHWHIVFGG